jgi:hypothetical protein
MPGPIAAFIERSRRLVDHRGQDGRRGESQFDQTRRSWARPVRSMSDLPEVYRELFRAAPDSSTPLPYAVLTPTYAGFIRRENERLVYCQNQQVRIVERTNGGLALTCYPIGRLNYVETGQILLYSWIKFKGEDSDGQLADSTFRFDTVSSEMFAPILNAVRPKAFGLKRAPGQDCSFEGWRRPSFKFMNYARRSILPGARVVQAVLQPEIHADAVRFMNVAIVSTVSPTHATIVTDLELIVIKEPNPSRWLRNDKYGGIWTFIPRSKISSVSTTRNERGLFALVVQLTGGDRLESLFSPAHEREAELIQEALQASI